MKLFQANLICVMFVLTPGFANAALIIDDFVGAGEGTFNSITTVAPFISDLDDDVAGTRAISFSGPGFSQIVTGSSTSILANAVGGQTTIDFDFDSPLDLHSSGAFAGSPLSLDLFSDVVGEFELDVTFTSSTTGNSASFDTVTVSSPTVVQLAGTDLGDGALASTVDGLTLTFTASLLDDGIDPAVATFSANPAVIAAVPEPMSIALLGLTGAGSAFVVRRRRRKQDSTKA